MSNETGNSDGDGGVPVVEESDHDIHRAGPDEGSRSPNVEELGHAEHSVFDGKGNETVVVTTTNAEGERVQATGGTREEALDNVEDTDGIGKGMGPAND